MKTTITLIIATLFYLLTSCGPTYQDGANHEAEGLQVAYLSNSTRQGNVNRSPLEMKAIRDPKTGRITSYFPLPSDWKLVTTAAGDEGMDGPDGISVHFTSPESYFFNVDPYLAQMGGKVVANPVPLASIFRDRVAPQIQKQGGQLINQYSLEETARSSHKKLQSALSRSRLQFYGIHASEWKHPDGTQSLILISQGIMHAQAGSNWWVSFTEVEAPSQSFSEAKDRYLFAIANWQPDQQTAQAHAANLGRMEAESQERLRRNAVAFNDKMRRNEAAFQERQRSHKSTYDAINSSSMESYRDRSNSQDQLRNMENNMIHEEQSAANPWGGESFQVQAGYQDYYMNLQGEVIGSNDVNFQPNTHRDFNHTQWRKVPVK